MKTKIILVSILLSAGLVTSASAAGRGGNANRGASRQGTCDMTGVPRNPNSTGTPLRDGSGKATAPGKGAKDGTGNRANCPVPPPTN